jgi:hypothetical protein
VVLDLLHRPAHQAPGGPPQKAAGLDGQAGPALAVERGRIRRVPAALDAGGGLRDWLNTHQDQVIITVCLLLGFWLAGKSIYLLVS